MADEFPTNFLKSSGDDFFKLLEEHFKTSIPLLIKRVLSFCDYNCAIVLAKLDDASIISMEDDIRNSFNGGMLVEGETLDNYLGRFVKCQKEFKFLDGQRKWFGLIAETCRRSVGVIASSAPTGITENVPATAEIPAGNFNPLTIRK